MSNSKRPSSEAGFGDLHPASNYGFSEESSKKDPGASSTSLDKEDAKCSVCLRRGHERTQCRLVTMFEEAKKAKKPRPPPKCEICSEEHLTNDCPTLDEYRRYELVANDRGEVEYRIKPRRHGRKLPLPKVEKPIRFETKCDICYKNHLYPCKFLSSVPKGAIVSPYWQILCSQCHDELDNSLWCPECKMDVNGYVGRNICVVCGSDMTAFCCPYGQLIGEKFHAAHPQLPKEWWT